MKGVEYFASEEWAICVIVSWIPPLRRLWSKTIVSKNQRQEAHLSRDQGYLVRISELILAQNLLRDYQSQILSVLYLIITAYTGNSTITVSKLHSCLGQGWDKICHVSSFSCLPYKQFRYPLWISLSVTPSLPHQLHSWLALPNSGPNY